MNANEVIATLAGDGVHPNDHVNLGQSSNDVFPSAVHLAALGEIAHDLLPSLDQLASSLERKATEFDDVVKSGRTHLMDAVPVTLGQEFAGYAAQIRQGIARVEDAMPRLGQIPLGGTATGTGLNTHAEFAARVRELLVRETGLTISAPADHFEAQAARDGLVEASGALKVVAVSLTKIANDLRLMGSGPRAGLSEIFLPELQKGSSIMPGKVNPVIPEVVTQVGAQVIGNDAAITVGGMGGHFELNVYVPLMARNLLDSIRLLASASRLLAERCVDGIEANRERNEHYAESTLAAATALNPFIGYDKASEIVKEATPRAGLCGRSHARRASTTRCSTRRSTTTGWPSRTADSRARSWCPEALSGVNGAWSPAIDTPQAHADPGSGFDRGTAGVAARLARRAGSCRRGREDRDHRHGYRRLPSVLQATRATPKGTRSRLTTR